MTTGSERYAAEAPLTCQRAAFALPENVHFLNCAYMGPLPKVAEQAGVEALARKRHPVDIVPPDDFWSTSDSLRSLFADLIGTPEPERVAIQPGVSYAVACAAKNLRVGAGRNVVILSEQFPGNVYAWRRLARESGAELRMVEPDQRRTRAADWNERLLEAIDANTAVAALPAVHWTDGTRFDLEAVGERCRETGAALIVDATQSLGMVPFSVRAVRPDLVVACCYKWLLGPYSVALTYFGPRFDRGAPLEETWTAREGSDDFRRLVEYRDAYRPGAARYDVAERSNFFLLPIARESLKLMLSWRATRLGEYCRTISGPALAELEELGIGIEAEEWRSPHLFGVRLPENLRLETLQEELTRRRISASLRGSALRVSVHAYNEPGDLEALVAVLRDFLTN